MAKQKPIDLSVFDEAIKSSPSKKIDLSVFDEAVKPASVEKKNPFQTVLPTGTKPSKLGFEPFEKKVPTETPSVLLSDEQKQQIEQEGIGKRFETTLLNIPTEFGRVGGAMKAAKQIKKTLPETPELRKYGEIPRMQPTAMTEGQRLGESLTEGADFRELTTDKFTEKKTGIQKQIENAENAFRAYQGDEIANQAQGYIPPEETLKIKQELGFGEKMSNAGSNFVNKLERFVPNTALAVGQTLTTLLGEDLGGDAYRMVTAGGNADVHRMEAFNKLAKLDAEYKPSKGLIQSVQDLDLGGVAAAVTDAVGSLVSSIVTSAPTAGLGLYADMVGGGLYDYNSTKANRLGITVDELYKTNQNEFFAPAIINGAAAQLEKIGLKGIKSAITKNMTKGAGQKFALIGHGMNKEGVTEWLQTGMETVSNNLAGGKSVPQAVEESVKTLFSKKGAESYLMGTIASGAAIGGGRILKGLFSDKSKKQAADAIQSIEQQQAELSNPDLSEESRTFIWENIQNNVNQLVNAVDEDVDVTEGLSEDQKREVNNLNTKIKAFEVVINDPAASEQTKKRAEDLLKETKAKIDAIIKKKPPEEPPATGGAMMEEKVEPVAKPTFDTEESLIEEGKKAEEEYKKTGDQVTYEQKIKELEAREKNLVPVPEEAELGKQRADRIAEIESILSNDDAAFVETGNRPLLKEARAELKAELDGLKKEQSVKKEVKTEVELISKPEEVIEDVKQKKFDIERQRKKELKNITPALEGKRGMVNTNLAGTEVSGSIGEGFTNIQDIELTNEEKAEAKKQFKLNDIEFITNKELSEWKREFSKRVLQRISDEINAKYDAELKALEEAKPEVTPEQQVEQLRADEQQELIEAIPNAEQYIVDGKVDRDKITDAEDLKKFDEIYDKYDKLITPLLPKTEVKPTKTKEDAIQVEAAGQVPIQPEATVSEEVVKGKPEAKPEVVTEEGKEEVVAKAPAKQKLKAKVNTRVLFKKAVDLFYDISGTEGSAKKRSIVAKRRTFMEQNPSIKYIDDNWSNISKQLEEKGLLKKEGNCP